MPNLYEVRLPGGGTATIEADSPPSKEDQNALISQLVGEDDPAPKDNRIKLDQTLTNSEDWKNAKPGDGVYVIKEPGRWISAVKLDNQHASRVLRQDGTSNWEWLNKQFGVSDVSDEFRGDKGDTSGLGTLLRTGISELPGAATGAAGFGATNAIPAVQRMQKSPWAPVKLAGYAAPLIGAISGAIGGSKIAEETRNPDFQKQLELDRALHPNYAAAGSVAAQAPFFSVGGLEKTLGQFVAQRGVPAAIGGALTAAQEYLPEGDAKEGALLRTILSGAGNAVFSTPTKLGQGLMDIGAKATRSTPGLNKFNITDKLNAKAGDPLPKVIETTQNVNPTDPLSLAGLTPEGEDLSYFGPFEPPVDIAPDTGLKLKKGDAAQIQSQESKLIADELLQSLVRGQGQGPKPLRHSNAMESAAVLEAELTKLEDIEAQARSRQDAGIVQIPAEGTNLATQMVAQQDQAKQEQKLFSDAIKKQKDSLKRRIDMIKQVQTTRNTQKDLVAAESETALKTEMEAQRLAAEVELEQANIEKTMADAEAVRKATEEAKRVAEEVAGEEAFAKGQKEAKKAGSSDAAPVKTDTGEPAVSLKGAEYRKIGEGWYRATGQEVTDPTTISILEANAPKIEKVNIGKREPDSGTGVPNARDKVMLKEQERLIAEYNAQQAAAKAAATPVPAVSKPSDAPVKAETPVKAQKPVKPKETPKAAPPKVEPAPTPKIEKAPIVGEPAIAERVTVKVEGKAYEIYRNKDDMGWYSDEFGQLSGGSKQVAKENLIKKATPTELQKLDALLGAKPLESPLVAPKPKEAHKAQPLKPVDKPAERIPLTKEEKVMEDELRNYVSNDRQRAAYEKAIDDVMDVDLDPEFKKSGVVRMAEKYQKQGLIDEKDVAEVKRLASDRDMGVEDVASDLKSTLEAKRAVKPKTGINQAGEKGVIYNPFSIAQSNRNSQITEIKYVKNSDGTFEVHSAQPPGKKSKYGNKSLSYVTSPDATYADLVNAFGPEIADRMQKAPVGEVTTMRNLTSAHFLGKSGMSSEAGGVINPITPALNAIASTAGKAINKANDFLLENMAKADTLATNPKLQGSYAKLLDDALGENSRETGVPAPNKELTEAISKADPAYAPGLTDLVSRFPSLDKPILRGVSKAIGSLAKGTKVVLGTIKGNIREISPRLVGEINNKEEGLNKMRLDFVPRADALGDLARKSLTPAEFNRLDAANLSGNREKAFEIFKDNPNEEKLKAAYEEHQNVMAEIRELEIETGREVGELENYFNRRFTEGGRDALKKSMGKEGESLYDDLINAAKKEKDRALTAEEEDQILNSFIAGSLRGAGGPGYLKPRVIQEITENMLKFYEPFDVSTHDYIMSVTRDISNRRFFGKSKGELLNEKGEVDDIGSVGKIINEEMKSGKMGRAGFKIATKNLRDYLVNSSQYDQELTKWANRARKLQTYGYLADAGNALIQGAEYFTLANKYGFGVATSAVKQRAFGDKNFSLEDLHIFEGGNQDMVGLRRNRGDTLAGKAINLAEAAAQKSMKTFIGKADQIMTGVSAESAYKWVSDVVRNPDSKRFKALNERYSAMFPDKWPEMLRDLQSDDFRNRKLNDNTASFLYNEVASLKPMGHGDRAQGYNSAGPWAKLLYSLRTYPIKQLDIMREIGYEQMKQGNVFNGIAELAKFAAIVGAGQQSVNYLRDQAFNRDVPPEEYAVTGMLQLVMVPRYAFYRAKQASYVDAVIDTAVPGLGMARDFGTDLYALSAMLQGQKHSDGQRVVRDIEDFLGKSRTVQYIPAVGRGAYWWAGRGAQQEKKSDMDRAMGKPKTGTLEAMLELVAPSDLKSPRKD